jgi:oxygen-independent coproporphyrinogen-3 oxidase
MAALYLHIPFCERKCSYCDFYSIESLKYIEPFVVSLRKEIELRRTSATDVPITSIFFGGGTPSLLHPTHIDTLLADLHRGWNIASDAEITMECNPGTVSLASLQGYRAAGVNRLSFGVQSFHQDELAFLQRIHSAEDAAEAMRLARQAGFSNVNMDVMFALPNQSIESFATSLQRLLELHPDHVSAYSLIFEHGTPLYSQLKKGLVTPQAEEVDAAMYALAMTKLTNAGYRQYEVSNFAKSGKECRHNLTYWHAEDHWSFGPSAHGRLGTTRYCNQRSLTAWSKSIEQGRLPQATVETLSPQQQLEEFVFLHLRSDGLPIDRTRQLFGIDVEDVLQPHLRYWREADMVRISNDSIALTSEGYRVCDEITVQALDCIDHSTRMASAINIPAARRDG